ncbi:MAG: toxin-antitoxin system, toxin component [Bacteroides sp.]|nr:toxin-antitoxin system, toxin component [Bacteroides sp.]MCM1457862.1 hypothetical protein [Lachnoclostridium sp.]
MTPQELELIVEKASFIVGGYAFSNMGNDTVSIIDLNQPHHAAIINMDGDIIETNMDDIEIEIVVNKYWATNKKQIIEQ